MTPAALFLLCCCGGAGACARFMADGWLKARLGTFLPFSTIIINVTGSLLLGLLTSLTVHGLLDASWQLAAGTGFLGGYTTFSTASYETVRLLQAGQPGRSLLNAVGTMVVALAAAAAGWALAACF